MSVESIKARLAAATPGPWFSGFGLNEAEGANYWDQTNVYALDERPPAFPGGDNESYEAECAWADEHERGFVAETHNHTTIPDNEHDANQLLIAHAPTDLALLLEVAQTAKTVRRMHQADGAVIALYLALDALEKAE